ncbi:MAG: hypothetical protein EOO61_16095, partial [Hymenobacter sp.]
MLDLADFVSRLKQVIIATAELSQNLIHPESDTGLKTIDNYRQALQTALSRCNNQIASTAVVVHNFRELGRILCFGISPKTGTWDDYWFPDERLVPLVDTWFALDEFL